MKAPYKGEKSWQMTSSLGSLCLQKAVIHTRNRFTDVHLLVVVHSSTVLTTLEVSLCLNQNSTRSPSPSAPCSNVIGGHSNMTGTQLLSVILNGADVCIKLWIPGVMQTSRCATHQFKRL